MYNMQKKCKITIDKIIFEIELKETPTALVIWNSLPIISTTNTWGEEIFFYVDVQAALETDAKSVVEFGEIAFWSRGKAIAIGFGKTPISNNSEIRLADKCNIWANTSFNLKKLKSIKDGREIKIEKI